MSDLSEALARADNAPHYDLGWQIDPDSADTIVDAARLVADAREPDSRNDKVLDWAEIHLGHYDWETALAAIDALMVAALGVEPGQRVKVVVIVDG